MMLHGESVGLLTGAIILGAVHGIEPGHGWPVAASYALDQTNKWVYGFAASLILGVGHLISSIAMVGLFFYAKRYFSLTQANDPITVFGNTQIGGPVSLVAGVLLIALGIREYRHGHNHTHATADDHSGSSESDQYSHSHEQTPPGEHDHTDTPDHDDRMVSRLKRFIPFVEAASHSHGDLDEAANRGLVSIAWFAFILGFAHEEEFEIIALCSGSQYCLELMGVYAITVIAGLVGLTMLLIAGHQNYEQQIRKYTPYLPAFSAAVLVIMGLGFIAGLL